MTAKQWHRLHRDVFGFVILFSSLLPNTIAAPADRRDFELANISISEPEPRVLKVDSDFNLTIAPGQGRQRNLRVRVFAGTRDQQINFGLGARDDCPKYDTLVIALRTSGNALSFGWGMPKEWAEIGVGSTRDYLLVFEKAEPSAPPATKWNAEPFRLAKECIRNYFDKGYRVQVKGTEDKPHTPAPATTTSAFESPNYVQLVKAGQCFRIRGGCGQQASLLVLPCNTDLSQPMTPALVTSITCSP